MRSGEFTALKSRLAGDPEKAKRFSEITEVISKKNSVRILVNSTGAFPTHPSKSENKK